MKNSICLIQLYLQRVMLAILVLVCGSVLLLGVSQNKKNVFAFFFSVLLTLLLLWFIPRIADIAATVGTNKILIFLLLICFLVKFAWILMVQVPISGDYAVFWGYANSFAESKTIDGGRYMALFPHIFGYAQFLSVFIRFWGNSELLPPILNVLLTVFTGYLIFCLCNHWLNVQAAISAFILWIACPSQTIYNSLVLSEPLYTMYILLFFYIITRLSIDSKHSISQIILVLSVGVICGILLRFIQGTRPIALILIIALIIWRIILATHTKGKRFQFLLWITLIVIMLVAYIIAGFYWNRWISSRIGEDPSTTPGYSVLVGFNKDSLGRWNQADSDRLYKYSDQQGSTAKWVQEQMFSDAIERISTENINYPYLFAQKLKIFMGSDDSCVSYSAAVLRHTSLFSLSCNGFYYSILILAIIGAIKLCKSTNGTTYMLVPLYVLGLVLAQMLVEVAGRYHYSIIPMLILICQPAIIPKERDFAK